MLGLSLLVQFREVGERLVSSFRGYDFGDLKVRVFNTESEGLKFEGFGLSWSVDYDLLGFWF
ncbi:expressed protein [Arabidopsis lyrata subsp. lyrata]|uniref:Expressed protein n=1 Tax=Arabidopsis lyrata subsp. lyrata TaxID=81972 RepID=D7LI90_ARALL|nr:expressed protein [Arabidopsis lyrata subsp. lyrata]